MQYFYDSLIFAFYQWMLPVIIITMMFFSSDALFLLFLFCYLLLKILFYQRVAPFSHLLILLFFSCQVGSNFLWIHGLYIACHTHLSFIVSWSLLKFMSIELVMLSNHLILCHPLLFLLSIFPSIRVFSSELPLHHVAKVLELQLQHQSFHEYSVLISFRTDRFDLLATQETLKSLF